MPTTRRILQSEQAEYAKLRSVGHDRAQAGFLLDVLTDWRRHKLTIAKLDWSAAEQIGENLGKDSEAIVKAIAALKHARIISR